MEGLPVKNTFIHFQFVDKVDARNTRRCRSEPPFSSARWERHNPGSMSRSNTRTCSSTTSNKENTCGDVGQSSKTHQEKRWSKRRPTKAQRKAFREYVDTLKEKLSENPATFSVDDMKIPKRFDRPQTKHTIATILARSLKERCGPAVSAAL